MSVVEIKIPSPGESITEVTIETWHKTDGEFVQVDEILCEIETDKATLPMPAEVAGTVQIVLQEGLDAKVGDVLCKIDTAGVPSADSSEPTTNLQMLSTKRWNNPALAMQLDIRRLQRIS